MNLSLVNIQKNTQRQSFTPQIQLTIKLLQLSNIELEDYIQKQMEDNPFLIEKETHINKSETSLNKLSDSHKPNATQENNIINNFNYTKSLKEHLQEQLVIAKFNNHERIAASYLINSLDDAGYLKETDELICQKIGISKNFYENLLTKLQGFEPTGVFSRTLQECLYIQLREKKELNEKLNILLSNIELLADDNFQELSKITGLNKQDLLNYINIIRKCNPKPGLSFYRDNLEVITPDIILEKNESGVYTVNLAQNILHNITLDSSYMKILAKKTNITADQDFFNKNYSAAKMIVNSIAQRQKTLIRIANEIIFQQRDFLDHGIHWMKPLNLEKISKNTELHMSTVSRSIQNKYIQTPRGTFEMKYLLDKGIGDDNKLEISSKSIESRIQQLIKDEKKDDVLSDEKIVTLLQKYDINIARRTVAKYRNKLNILPSSKRKNRFI